MMELDPATRSLLEGQYQRLRHVLYEVSPPDRKEAELIRRRIDDILDRRPRVVGVAPDGEVVFENASDWIQSQLGSL